MAVAFGGFALWLGFAASPASWVTVPIFAAMLASLVVALRRLGHHHATGARTGMSQPTVLAERRTRRCCTCDLRAATEVIAMHAERMTTDERDETAGDRGSS